MMTLSHFRLTLVVLLTAGTASAACGQEMRVYTTVRNLAAQGPNEAVEKAPILARSLTLFHAGKVYDYVDSAREVTIHEPALRRFMLLSERRGVKSEVAHDEIRQFLSLAEQEAEKRLSEANKQTGPSQVRSLAWLKFQLHPEFTVSFDQKKSELQLLGRGCRYEADGMAAPSPDVTGPYLKFADAMAELNSVLHPRAMLPAPRMKLNEELRRRELLPVSVELRADLDRPVWLQARHEWTWKFSSTDRQLISNWEKQLDDAAVRKIPFRQYQHELLSADVAKKK